MPSSFITTHCKREYTFYIIYTIFSLSRLKFRILSSFDVSNAGVNDLRVARGGICNPAWPVKVRSHGRYLGALIH